MRTTASELHRKVDTLESATAQIFGASTIGDAISHSCADARQDIEDIVSRRGVHGIVVSVIGHKDAGKSTLCRLLVKNPEARNLIPAGTGRDNATDKITWIGGEFPENIDRRIEREISLGGEDLEDIGIPYTLVDVPGFSDPDPGAREAARRALRTAAVALVVTDSDQIEDEAVLGHARQCDGCVIVPVVAVRGLASKLDHPDGKRRLEEDLAYYRSKIMKWCPAAEVFPVIRIPRVEGAADTEQAKNEIRGAVIDALKTAKSTPVPDPIRPAANRVEKLRSKVRKELDGFLRNVEPHYRSLREKEDSAAAEVGELLVGRRNRITSGIRVRMLDQLAKSSPPFLFPYRSFLGLLTLLSGAWDRLLLAMVGSVPSLISAVFQSGRNVQKLAERKQAAREELERRANQLATGYLATQNKIFLRSVTEALPPEAKAKFSYVSSKSKLTGVDELQARTEQIFEECMSENAPKGRLSFAIGMLSMFIWIGLAAGPTWAVYYEFFGAWNLSFSGPESGGWSEFPVPSGKMIWVTLMLVFGPVFALAMFSLVVSVSQKRVRVCSNQFHRRTKEIVGEFVRDGLVRLETDDELRDAVRSLLEELITEHACSEQVVNSST